MDLAGSEKAGENTGDRFREGCSINKSLFTLARIIAKLSEGVRYNIFSLVLSLIMRFTVSIGKIEQRTLIDNHLIAYQTEHSNVLKVGIL